MILAGVVRSRLRLARNTVLGRPGRAAPRRLTSSVLALALIGLLAGALYTGLGGAFAWLSADGRDASQAGSLLTLVFSAALAALLLFDLHEALGALLSDSDLVLLRRAPLAPAALFGIKLADSLPRTSLILLVTAVPAALAFHRTHPLPVWAWLMFPLQLAGLWAIPLGTGLAVALVLLRLAPSRYVREGFGLLSTFVLAALWLANSFLLPKLANTSVDPIRSLQDLLAVVPETYRWSPGQWAALAISGASRGDAALATRMTLALLTAAGGAMALAAGAATFHLDVIQSRLAARPGGARRPRGRLDAARPAGSDQPRGLIPAMLSRDARLVTRDWTLFGGIVTTAALWTMLPIVLAPVLDLKGRALARLMLLALTVPLGYEVGARALPLERRGIEWMRLAPVAASRWITARFAGVSLASALLLGLAATVTFLALDVPAHAVLQILCIVTPALSLSLATGVWAGAAFGDPGWRTPQSTLTLPGRIVTLTLLLIQVGLWNALAVLMDARPPLPLAVLMALGVTATALGAALPLRTAASLCERPRRA